MSYPTLKKINEIRKSGFRPQVVGCFLFNKKILFVFDDEYKLWQLPQGGIDNHEIIEKAGIREMTEELGDDFISGLELGEIISENVVEFSPHKQGIRELKTDEGNDVFMLGKRYFFVVMVPKKDKLNLDQTEFDEYKWLNFSEALDFAQTIYQKGKRRITIKAIQSLHKKGFI